VSAVEEYRKARAVCKHRCHRIVEAADAAIAELEAQIASLIADWNKEHPKRLDAEAELAALKEDFKHLRSRWDYTQYWFANLYPVDWDRCQEKYNRTKTGSRAEEGTT